jgi:putative transposase
MSSNISKNRKKYLLKIHLIFACKYRKKLLINPIDKDIKQIMLIISSISDFKIDIMETDQDHIHLLLNISPNYSISSIVNRLKSISTNMIWKKHHNLLVKHFWKEKTFWSDGYFVNSIGNANLETVRHYIENQG